MDEGTLREKVVKIDSLDETIRELISRATLARDAAYAPYSGFAVGACVLCTNGDFFDGCNVENRCLNVGVCAERCAYVKAISAGRSDIGAVAVVAHQERFYTTPCGACRQFMSEFGDVVVYVAKPQAQEVLVMRLEELLPHQFRTVGNSFE